MIEDVCQCTMGYDASISTHRVCSHTQTGLLFRMKQLLALLLLLIPSAVLAAPDGTALYASNCEACHGKAGQGGVGVPLAMPDFLASVDDHFLRTTIRLGRPGRVMPAFSTLSEAELDALVAYIRGWMPEGMELSLPKGPVKGDVKRGAELYKSRCASCHGANGEGGHGTGVTFSRPRDLAIIPPALNNYGFLKSASDPVIKATLMRGREGTPMVSFLKQGLSEQDIDDIVSYVRAFERHTRHWQPGNDDQPVMRVESSYSLEETVENIKRAAIGKNFRIIRIQNLEDGLFAQEQQSDRQVIIYFCNFNFINQALALDPRVGIFMPCRVTAVEHDGVVEVMSINPKYLSRLYNNAELDAACDEMYRIYTDILEEATL